MTHLTPSELKIECKKRWGVEERRQKHIFDRKLPLLLDFWDFQNASDDMKAFVAYKLIIECTPVVGAFWDNGDMLGYIYKFSHDIAWSRGSIDDRRVQVIRSALLNITYQHNDNSKFSPDVGIALSGGASLAVPNLMATIEFLLRTRSRYLDSEGKLTRILPRQLQMKVNLSTNRPGYRVNQLQKAFYIFVYRNTREPAPMLRDLERKLKIGERLNRIRNPTMHGMLPDPVSEAPFYALLLAIFYYTEVAS